MKTKIWTTKKGDQIPYSEIEIGHLKNILCWIEKNAKEGMMICAGGGYDPDTFWYDEEWIEGKDVYDRYDYHGLLDEFKKRDKEKYAA